MAKRLNKNMVVVLTSVAMLSSTALVIGMLMALPGKDPRVAAQKAEQQAEKGEYQMAVKYYMQAYTNARQGKRSPSEINGYLVKAGDMALKSGDAGQARELWKKATLADPNHAEAQEKLVRLYLDIAKLQGGRYWGMLQIEANALLAIPKQEKNFVGLHAVGRALIEQRGVNESNLDEGKARLIEAFNGDKSNPEFAESLAQFHLQQGQPEEAVRVYEVLLDPANRPHDQEVLAVAYRDRGQLFLKLKRTATQKHHQRKAEGASKTELATLQKEVDRLDALALADLEEAVRLAPQNVDALVALGGYWHSKESDAGDTTQNATEMADYRAKADDLYRRAIKADPEDFSGYLQLSQLYSQQNKLEEAYQVLQSRIERGIRKEHYLGWRNQVYMGVIREEAFRLNLGLVVKLPNQPEFESERKKLMDRLNGLYRKTVGDSTLSEKDPAALFMQGRLSMLAGDRLAAIKALEEARDRSGGGTPQLRQILATLYMETNSPGLAEEILSNLTAAYPTNDWAWAMLGRVYVQLNRPNKAIDAANAALKINPDNKEAFRAKIDALRLAGDYEAIRKLLPQGDDISTADKMTKATALILEAGNDPAPGNELTRQAAQLLQEVVEADLLNIQALRQLVSLLGRRPEGAESVRKVLADQKAAVEKKMGGLTGSDAEETKKKYVAMLRMIDVLGIYADPKASADDKYNRVRELVERETDPYTREVDLFELKRRTPGKEAEAWDHLKKAYEIRPNEPNLISVMFQYALSEKNWKLAEECVDKAIKMNLDNGNGHFFRGQLLTARTDIPNHLSEAVREFRAGLQDFPNYATGQLHLGNALMQLRYYDEAARAFEEALRLNPTNTSATIGLAMVADVRGDAAEANRLLNLCAKSAPNHPWVQTQLQNREDQRDPQRGIARREAIRKQAPDDLNNLTQLADLYNRQGQAAKAGEVLSDALQRHPTNLGLNRLYAQFLRNRVPPAAEEAEKALRTLVDRIDPQKKADKAAAHLLLAEHLKLMSFAGMAGAPNQQQLDEIYVQADAMSPTPEVRVEIGVYFVTTERPRVGEEWFRKAIASATGSDQAEIRRQARTLLIESIIRSGEVARADEAQRELDTYRKEFPDDKRGVLFQGELYAMSGRDTEAVEQFTQFINQASNPIMGYYRRAAARFRRSEFDEAISDLERVRQQSPDFSNYEARILLAKAYQGKGLTQRAIEELQSILRENERILGALQELFQIYLGNRPPMLDAAQRLIEPRMAADPNNHIWPHLLSAVAKARGDGNRAVTLAEDAVKLSNNQPKMVYSMLNTMVQVGRFDEAIAYISEKIPENERSAPIRVLLGAAYAAKKDPERCINELVLAYNAPDISLESLYRTFVLEITTQLDINQALELVTKRLERNPDDQGALFLQAGLAGKKDNTELYIQAIQKLVELTPKEKFELRDRRAFMLRQLAMARRERRELAEVRKLYEEILGLDPENVFSLNNLAVLLTDDLKEPEAGLRYAQRAAELAPNNAAVLDTLGWAQVLTSKYDDGIATLRKAIDLSPNIAALHYHLADAYLRRSEAPNARNPREDRMTAESECKRAHQLLMQSGVDSQGVFELILQLGEKLGLTLEKKLPVIQSSSTN